MPPIRPELLDELLKDYQKPDDLLGQDGLLQQLILLANPAKLT